MRYTFSFIIAAFLLASTAMTAQQARLQVIHNAADPAAATVDIYVNNVLFEDDFAFRTATAFADVPAGVPLGIGVAPGNSTGPGDILTTFNVTLDAGKTYVAVANGVLNTSNFAANPDSRSTAFTLFTTAMGQESGTSPAGVDINVLHGATDAPTVDVINRGSGILVNDAAYGDMTGYLTVPATSYKLDITPGNDNNTIVASFEADLTGLGGGAAVVFASGFLAPAGNQNGPAFGLFAALPNGTVVALPAIPAPTARLQVIHNAADPSASSVDIYVNGGLFQNDFAFRTATPFVTVPAEVQLTIGVAPGNSTGPGDIIATFPVTLSDTKTYVVAANGVLNTSNFAANPDSRSTAFTLFTTAMGQESGTSAAGVDINVLHGATDAPGVDVIARGVGTLVDDAAYGDMTGYFTVPAGKYILDITPGGNNNVIVASFVADLNGLGGAAAVVFASGFLSPAANQNGPAFGLYAALPNGTVVELPLSVYVDVMAGGCPNPFNVRAQGKLPVSVLGTSWFDVSNIDATTVRLNGVAPTGSPAAGDVAMPYMAMPMDCGDCSSVGMDMINDWTFKFERPYVTSTLGAVSNNDCVPVVVTGQLNDGRAFIGSDVLRIIKNGKGPRKSDAGISSYALVLEQNAPNPVLTGTSFRYTLPNEGNVTLEVYDALGQRVATVVSGFRAAGVHTASWDGLADAGNALPAGTYIYRLNIGGQVVSKMLVLAR
ncbi:DUF4397 domain-containing protein [bacterium]|nr:DUF4397 domain-containing protein [bacterium]